MHTSPPRRHIPTVDLATHSLQHVECRPPADSQTDKASWLWHSLSSNLESKEGQERIQEGCVTWLPCLSCGPGSQVTLDSTDRCGTAAWLRPESGVCPCPLGCGRTPLPFCVVPVAYPSQPSTEPLPPISSSSGRGAVPATSQRQSVLMLATAVISDLPDALGTRIREQLMVQFPCYEQCLSLWDHILLRFHMVWFEPLL